MKLSGFTVTGNLKRSAWISIVILLLLLIIAVVFARRQLTDQQSVGGPMVPIPDSPGCSVQLLAGFYKQAFLPGEPVYVDATLLVHGPCTWRTVRRDPVRNFILIIDRTNSQGNVMHLADEETYWANEALRGPENDGFLSVTVDAEHPFHPVVPLDLWFGDVLTPTSKYDFSQPGTYTMKLVHLSFEEPQRVPSNEVTFRRKSSLQTTDQQSVDAPWVPISKSPGCSVRLLAELDRHTFFQGESVYVNTTLRVRGPCTWRTSKTNPFIDFILVIDRTDPQGSVMHLANEETYFENASRWPAYDQLCTPLVDAEHPYSQTFLLDLWFDTAYTQTSMYDISQPGTYTLRFIHRTYDPYDIPSNVITFTRKP